MRLLPTIALLLATSAAASEPPAPAGSRRAARQLQAELQTYPQDTLLALRTGDAWLAVGAWSRAEQAYRQALELSGGGEPAQRGLSAVQMGRAPLTTLSGSAAGSGYDGDVDWVGGGTLGLSADAVLHGRALIGASARAGAVTGKSGTTPWAEAHLGVGAGWNRAGFMVHVGGLTDLAMSGRPPGGRLADPGTSQRGNDDPGPGNPGNGNPGPDDPTVPGSTPVVGQGWTTGVSGRWSPWGELYVEGSRTAWTDGPALRGLVAWTSPAVGPLRVEPGGSLASDGDGLGWTALLTLRLHRDPVSVHLGGRVGDEARPTSLGLRSFWAVPGRVQAGAWAGMGVRSGDWRIGIDGEWVHMERTAGSGPPDAFVVALALSKTSRGVP